MKFSSPQPAICSHRERRWEGKTSHALSVSETERLSESGCFRAKMAQEKMISGSSIVPVVTATQFFEVLKQLADVSFAAGRCVPGCAPKASCGD